MKKFTLRFFGLTLAVFFSLTNAKAEISSTTVGGDWNSASTWIGGIIPGSSDNVLIKGDVNVTTGASCAQLTLNSGVRLQNLIGSNITLDVYGTISNSGTIANNASGSFSIDARGDISNNGIWEINATYLGGTGPQLIALQSGKLFKTPFTITNSTDTVKATTDLVFTKYFNLNSNILNLDNHNIRFAATNTYFGNGTILSPSEFRGEVNMYVTTTIEGNLIVTDTLQNRNASSVTVYLNGNLTNNGVIQNNTSLKLTLYLSGDINITNNGTWENSYTRLNGNTAQNIYLSTGKTFGSDFTVTNSSDTIHALTGLVIDGYFDLNTNILDLNSHNVEFIGAGHYFGNGTILSPSEFRGEVNIYGTTTIEDNLIITDTLQNKNSNNVTVYLNGNLTNNGVIQNNTSLKLTLYLSGDINGTWDNYLTYLKGTSDQSISMMNAQYLTGEVRFDANFGSSPYQWYYNGTVLDSTDFTGETSANLNWLVPVTDTSWYGTFYCQTGDGDSRNIRVNYGLVAFQFDGIDNYVNCGHDASLNLTTTMTIEAWVNPSGWGKLIDYGWGRIVDKSRFKLFLNDNPASGFNAQSLVFIIHSGGSSYSLNTPDNSVSLNSWQHIAATYDGNGDVHVYIDGVEQPLSGTPPSGSIDDNSLDDLFIGESFYQNRAFDGNIDEVRIWNIVLDTALIRENIYRTLSGNETGLVSYWQFNEYSGPTAYDLVSGNDGTLFNMTDANRLASTAPIPFQTVGDGNWESNNIWATGQNAPVHPWSRAIIKNNVTLNSNMELMEMTVDPGMLMTISTGDTLTIGGQ
ncbi:MAG: LamG domain-containing protein [Chlorobi bacterium]|nr:LamG domain-containing protein [Chlorobiota bacterium]